MISFVVSLIHHLPVRCTYISASNKICRSGRLRFHHCTIKVTGQTPYRSSGTPISFPLYPFHSIYPRSTVSRMFLPFVKRKPLYPTVIVQTLHCTKLYIKIILGVSKDTT